jgi:hypothetical protein
VGLDIVLVTHIDKRKQFPTLYALLTFLYISMLVFRIYEVVVERCLPVASWGLTVALESEN